MHFKTFLTLWALSAIIVNLICFISRLYHSYWEWNLCLKRFANVRSQIKKKNTFYPHEVVGRGSVGENLNNFIYRFEGLFKFVGHFKWSSFNTRRAPYLVTLCPACTMLSSLLNMMWKGKALQKVAGLTLGSLSIRSPSSCSWVVVEVTFSAILTFSVTKKWTRSGQFSPWELMISTLTSRPWQTERENIWMNEWMNEWKNE